MSVSLAMYAWPVTVLLFILLLVGIERYRARGTAAPGVPWVWIVPGMLFPIAILLYGSAFHATGPNWTPRAGAERAPALLYGCLAADVLFVALVVWRAPGARGIVAALGALQVWWAMGAVFVALMSVSGQWL